MRLLPSGFVRLLLWYPAAAAPCCCSARLLLCSMPPLAPPYLVMRCPSPCVHAENVNIGAIAFKPCKEGADFSKPLGVKGRALELATQANEPERMKRSAFSVRDAAEWSERAALRAEEAAREAKEALAQAKARGATDAQAAEQAFMERFQKNQRKFDGTEGLNRIWADDGELPLSGFKARQGDVVDALQMTRNLKYDDDYLGADGAGAAADPADQFAKFYDANPEMGAKIKVRKRHAWSNPTVDVDALP